MPETRFKPLPWTRLKRGVPCYLPRAAGHASVDANSPALEGDDRLSPPDPGDDLA
jgi:hypothetical protein